MKVWQLLSFWEKMTYNKTIENDYGEVNNVYKVIIVDDEPIIVKGLSQIVSWEKYHCQVVGTAIDGAEGLKLIREKRPDILFTDICMQGVDGLSMVAAFRVEFPNLQVAILTGYRDFDYAQQAIRLGVTRFLLKPSNLDELEEAVQAMIHNLKERNLEGEEEKTRINSAGSFIVKNAMEYIREHYEEKLTLEKVAENIYVSHWHLSRLLNQHLEKNFSDLLNQVRLEKAKELLKNPSYRVSDVGEMVGFTDAAHFSRVFKKLEGISANEYRNQKC